MNINKYGAIALGIGLLAGSAHATTEETWSNSGDNDFTNSANWSSLSGPLITNDTWQGIVNSTGADYCEFNSPGLEAFVQQLKVGISGNTGEFRLVDGIINMHDRFAGGFSYAELRIGQSAGHGIYIQSGGTNIANYLRCPLDNNSSGEYYLSGGQLEVYSGGGNNDSALVIGANGANTGMGGYFEVSGGTISNMIRGVELGNSVGSTGTFHVVGTGPDAVIFGDNMFAANGYGQWLQHSNSVLKVGIDGTATGVTPIELQDNLGSGENATMDFRAGALLQPYFTGASHNGKFTVATFDSSSWTDFGLELAPGTDSGWTFTITNLGTHTELQVWYGLGPSGYVPPSSEGPVRPAPGRTLEWVGAAGDNDSSTATNWNVGGVPAGWGINEKDNVYIGSGSGPTTNIVNFTTNSVAPAGGWLQRRFLMAKQGGRYCEFNQSYGKLWFEWDNQLNYVGEAGATGVINLSGTAENLYSQLYLGAGGTGIVHLADSAQFKVSKGKKNVDILGVNRECSAYIGRGTGGWGQINLSGGSYRDRFGVWLGQAGGIGNITVMGTAPDYINFGGYTTSAGFLGLESGSSISVRIDDTATGITPIEIKNAGSVAFMPGSELDVDWMAGVTNGGTFKVVDWAGGTLLTNGLSFASGVDTNTWSMSVVGDALYVTATGVGPTVVPNITAFSVSGSTVSLMWDSETGVHYNILSKSALTAGTWATNVLAIPGAGATTSTNLTTSGASEEFFKIEAN